MVDLCCIMMMQGLGLIVSQLKDIETLIDESLEKQFSRTRETNRYYEKIKERLMKDEKRLINHSGEIREMIMTSIENKDKETLV